MSAMDTIQVQAGSTRLTRLPAALTKRPDVGLKSGSLPDKHRGVGVSCRGVCPSQNTDCRESPAFMSAWRLVTQCLTRQFQQRLVNLLESGACSRYEGSNPSALTNLEGRGRKRHYRCNGVCGFSLVFLWKRATGSQRSRFDSGLPSFNFPISGVESRHIGYTDSCIPSGAAIKSSDGQARSNAETCRECRIEYRVSNDERSTSSDEVRVGRCEAEKCNRVSVRSDGEFILMGADGLFCRYAPAGQFWPSPTNLSSVSVPTIAERGCAPICAIRDTAAIAQGALVLIGNTVGNLRRVI